MFNDLKNLITKDNPEQHFDEIFEKLRETYPQGEDPWGLNLKRARKTLEFAWPLYKKYFKVRLFNKDRVPNKPLIVVSNHSGQIALDGMLISTAFSTEIEPQRLLRPMVERFFTKLPFLATLTAESGAVLGDRKNCLKLLKQNESILVFPEGVRGVSKSTSEYYQVQSFTKGFFRMALKSGVDILPLAVIGAEEIFPLVYQAKDLAKQLNLPALPITPLYFPLPSPVDIHFGEVISLPEGMDGEAPDEMIQVEVNKIKTLIQKMVDEGLQNRRDFWANRITQK